MKVDGKKLGLTAFIFTQIIFAIAFFLYIDRKEMISFLQLQLGVLAIVWGAVGYKNYLDKKRKPGDE